MRGHLKDQLAELCPCDNSINQLDIESEWISFKNTLMSSAKAFIPATVNVARKKKPNRIYPINKDTKLLINRKHRLWTRFQETRDVKVHAEFKKIRNLVRKETRKIATTFQSDIAHSCKKNPKKFWQFINSKSKTVRTIGNIIINDVSGNSNILENDLDKANAFNEYFINVCASVPSQAVDNLAQIMPNNSMDELLFSEDSVLSKLNKLKTNTSPGPDLIHPKILYEMRDIVSPYLYNIFQQSLIQGYLPTDWKSSSVTVIHKKGKRDNVGNYRPISLTSICCKTLESIIKDNIVYYFKSNNLFSKFQYGFINGRSVLIQLLKVLDDWTSSIDDGNQVDVVYTDFEKAFDRISHKHLISKLLSYGINDKLVTWISSFLFNRTQCVKINGVYSSKSIVTSGVPQGSVLGPLLFVIYINDLPDVCRAFSSLFLFADDAKMYRTLQCDTDYLLLQDCCNLVSNWSRQWCMNLNVDKCKVLSITAKKCNKNINNYFIDSKGVPCMLENVESMNDLGVTIDHTLDFSVHIQDKINKAYQMLGIINRNFKDLGKISFLLLYKCLVRSHLEYASSVWNPYKISLISDLEKVQKRATKMVSDCRHLSYKNRLIHLNLPTLKFRRARGDMIEVYKILQGLYDSDIVPLLLRNTYSATRGNKFKLAHVRSHYDLRKYSFCSRVVGLWNTLPDYIVSSLTLNAFKNSLDKFWSKEEMFYDWEASLTGMIL
jgi:hypothetical protein